MADRDGELAKLGLRADLPTGILLFGGHGSKAILEIVKKLDASTLNLQLICICGRNAKLATELRGQKWRIPVHVEEFTSRVNYFMQLADLFIGKPGPGSMSEALAMKLPVIVECNAWTLPQERYNATWVTEKQVGIVLKSFDGIVPAVEKLIEPSTLENYRANAAALRNRAVFEIPAMLEEIAAKSSGAPFTDAHDLVASPR